MKTTVEDGRGVKSHTFFIRKESGCDLNKGNDTQKGNCAKTTPSELAVLTTQDDKRD